MIKNASERVALTDYSRTTLSHADEELEARAYGSHLGGHRKLGLKFGSLSSRRGRRADVRKEADMDAGFE